MDMTGEYRIPAPRAKVWAALNDPATLKASLPGCESLEKVGDNQFAATVVAKVGPVKAKFNGNVALSNLNPPESYTIAGEGKGGAAGFAKGGADVRLTEDGAETTLLSYTAKADVGGKLAQLGSRLIDGTAKKMADEFFDNFVRQVAGPPPPAEAELLAETEIVPEPAPVAGGVLGELTQNRFVWAGAAIIVLMILALLLR
jgi:carbon monoxide dehydrogenase subunit G